MTKRRKIIEFLVKPPLAVCIAVWIIGALALAGSITLYYLDLGLKLWALSVHITALVFFILSIYAVLTVIGIPARARESVKVKQFFSSYDTRAFVYATGSVLFNTCYVAFGIVIAVLTHSPWLGALVGYHIFLILPRLAVLYIAKVKGRRTDADAQKQQIRAYAYAGLALILLAFAFAPIVKLTVEDKNSYHYFVSAIVYVTAIAAYTFTKLGISIYNLKKVRKHNDMSLIAVKNISFADALISMFALQAMMLKVLDVDTAVSLAAKMNPAFGAVIVMFIFGFGLHMIITGVKKLKAYNNAVETNTDVENKIDGNEDITVDS